MSWFGFGGDSKKSEDHHIDSSPSSGFGQTSFPDESSFSSPSNDFSAPRSNGAADFQQQVMVEQQKIMIQALMFKLTTLGFENCVTKPSSSLSSSEKSCIQATVSKYLDTTEFIVSANSK